MASDDRTKDFFVNADFFICERIGHLKGIGRGIGETHFFKVNRHIGLAFGEVIERESIFTAGQMFHKRMTVHKAIVEFDWRTGFDILINTQQILVGDQFESLLVHIADITAEHQRGAGHAPQRELRAVISIVASAGTGISLAVHANSQHIHVVEAAV